MRTHPRILLLALFLLVVASCPSRQRVQRVELSQPAPAELSPAERWPELSDRALGTLWELYPGRASALGIHRYDRQLPRRSGKILKVQVDNLTRAVQNLYAIPGDALTADEQIDRQVLIASLRLAIHEIAVEGRPLLAPTDDVDELMRSVLSLWLDGSRPLEVRLEALAARLLEVPLLLSATRDNLHLPSRRLCQAAAADAGALRRFLDNDLRAVAERSEAGLRERLGLGIDEAMLGLERFIAGIDGRCADGPELTPVGAVAYGHRLSLEYGLNMDAAAVLDLGQQWLQTAHQQLDGLPAVTVSKLSAPTSFTRRALLDTVATQARTLRGLVDENHLISPVSSGDTLRVVETPPLLRDRLSALSLVPPPAFGQAEPLLLVGLMPLGEWTPAQRDALFTELTRSDLLLATARETYPGRMLRHQLARRQASVVRRAQDSVILDEGWALYAMGMALEHNLVVADTVAQRTRWQAIREAAARVVVDVNLHTGVLNFEQAVRALAEEDLAGQQPEAARRAVLEREVIDLLKQPAHGAAALIGFVAIERMRERAEAYKGLTFDLRRFHDALLGQGSIPPAYIAHVLFRDPLPTLEPFVPPGQVTALPDDAPAMPAASPPRP
ncbi:MAG: DUF885 family protein [Pseudomonadota bacterium]